MKTRSRIISYSKYESLRSSFEWHYTHTERFGSEVEHIRGSKRYLLRDVCGTKPRLTIEYRELKG